ncbi:type IV secretory system conjugative DNA transfer family protein [Oscillospiraceae bacterium OttesenSCG-928-F05]|nr:type IV secretory system conjugative DNA transfer family protein [Oscillospiraceae bacterium OttesenSCG-928-F05]
MTALLWAVLFLPVAWAALLLTDCYMPGDNIIAIAGHFTERVKSPFDIPVNDYTPRALIAAAVLYGLCISAYYATRRKERPGEEHGSAQWGDPHVLNAKYANRKNKYDNIILTKHISLGMDSRKHQRNKNVLVIGGSGAGKTRFYCKPNLMNANCSYIVTDPKGELLRASGQFLRDRGYDIKVLDLINMDMSDGYNPFAYLDTDEDAFKLISNLIRNTTPPKSQNNDPFWEKSESALLSALILYLHHEAPEDEQNFSMVMYMIENGAASEDDESYTSPLDILFDDLEQEDPEHIALKEFKIFKQAAGKTAKSILVSAAVRLAAFLLPKFQAVTSRDDLDIGSMGERKRAIFAVIPDNDDTFNYLVGMLYTQAFQALFRNADHKHGGRLPIHVRFIMDEFSNVANLSPDDFLRALQTMRSREISVSIIIQTFAALKKQFGNEAWEAIPGNCDTILYLGGNEPQEYLSKHYLGKATIDTRTSGKTQGKQGSYSQNFQNAGRELLTSDEIRRMDNKYALLFIRGEYPVMDEKYDILKHPNVKFTEDGGAPPYLHKGEWPDYSDDSLMIDFNRLEDYEIS